jgi:hypothetical protein
VVAVYEAKQAEVLREAAGLRAALEHLQKEHRALINQQVCWIVLDGLVMQTRTSTNDFTCKSAVSTDVQDMCSECWHSCVFTWRRRL